MKSALALVLRCQPTYVSQVIHGEAHFSLEQAEKVGRHLGLAQDELRFLLLLVQKDRAGTADLRQLFQEQLEELKAKRLILRERLGAKASLSKEDQARYYSSWHFAAVHIAVTIPSLAAREKLARQLQISRKRLNEVVNFLLAKDLLREHAGVLSPGISELRLGNDSENIVRHHANWRIRALQSLDQEALEELHYSAVVSLSRKDVFRIKDMILESIKGNLEVIRGSREEELFCFTVDFFNLAGERVQPLS